MTKLCIFVLLFYSITGISLYSLDNPELLVQFPSGGRITAVAVDSKTGVVYFSSEDRYLYALDETYKLLWRFELPLSPVSSLTVGEDHSIYAGLKGGKLVAVNPSGREIWTQSILPVGTDDNLSGNVLTDADGNIYAFSEQGYFLKISHTGISRFKINLGFEIHLQPVMNSRYLFIPASDGRIYAYDHWGIKKWIFVPAGDPVSVCCSETTLFCGTEPGTLVSVDMEGRKKISTLFPGPVTSLLLGKGGNVYCSSGGSLYSVGQSGNVRWVYNGREKIFSIGLLGPWIFVSDEKGRLLCLTDKGGVKGFLSTGKPKTSIVGFTDSKMTGNIIIGSGDWNMYAVGYSSVVVAENTSYKWPFVNGPPSSGRVAVNIERRPTFGDISDNSNDFNYLNLLVQSHSRKEIKAALDSIEERLADFGIDKGKSFFLPLLERIASEATIRPVYQNNILINDYPLLRIRACKLLGRYGDFRSQDILLNLLKYEWEDYAINSIIEAIGSLGTNPEYNVTKKLYNFFLKLKDQAGNESLSNSLLFTLNRIYHYTGELDEKGGHLLVSILLNSSSRDVRQRALDLISLIKNQSSGEIEKN